MVDDSHGKDSPDDFYAQLEAARAQDTKDQPLDPDIAREEAKKLAQKEKDIDELSDQVLVPYSPKGDDLRMAYHIPIPKSLSIHGAFKGLGSGNIYLDKHYESHETDYFKPHIQSRYTLNIGLHEDQTTEHLAQAANTSNPGGLHFSTTYLFDTNGNFDKLVWLPTEIHDDRPTIVRSVLGDSRLVQGQMTPGDFELAGTALQILEAKVRQRPPRRSKSTR